MAKLHVAGFVMVRPIRRFIPCLLTLPIALAPGQRAQASAPVTESAFRTQVELLLESGAIRYEDTLLVRFQRVFEPALLPDQLASPHAEPVKSVTLLINEYGERRLGLSASVSAAIEEYLRHESSASAETMETEHFRLTYELSGPDAVSSADTSPANGIPDFVERIGQYAEISWKRLFEDAGFEAPALPHGKYRIFFREMSAFGYTIRVDGSTDIFLHRNFIGFPENHDPEGSENGAAKVALAHELKHASQYTSSAWSERGWLEADATWAEDLVFDETNDYLRYLPEGSPVSHPGTWLEPYPEYEDCLWQHLLAEKLGPAVLVDFFEYRASHQAEPVARSFDQVLRTHGSSLSEMVRSLGLWSYFSGANAARRPVGFEEAALYPTPPVSSQTLHSTETVSESVSGMGSHFIVVGGPERIGTPRISFAAGPGTQFSVHAVTTDLRGFRSLLEIPLESSKISRHPLPMEWAQLALLSVVVSNVAEPSAASDYFLGVEDDLAVGVEGVAEGHFQLLPNRPNPFRSSTSIVFTLGARESVRLSIYDVGGRLVRRLMERRVSAGEHETQWDGLDEAGRLAAPGLYYYRLETNADSQTRRMLLLR